MLLGIGLFLTVDSECRLDALITYYVFVIYLAVFNRWISACVTVCGCFLKVLGLFLMVDSEFVAAYRGSLNFF